MRMEKTTKGETKKKNTIVKIVKATIKKRGTHKHTLVTMKNGSGRKGNNEILQCNSNNSVSKEEEALWAR